MKGRRAGVVRRRRRRRRAVHWGQDDSEEQMRWGGWEVFCRWDVVRAGRVDGWGWQESERGVGGKLGQCPDSEHQRPRVPGCPVSALWQERWDFNTEFFTTRRGLPLLPPPSPLKNTPPPPWCTHQSEFEERNALVTIRRAHGMGPEALSAASSMLSVELEALPCKYLWISKVDVE